LIEFVCYDASFYYVCAFGMGLDRIAMVKYVIENIRQFYTNDHRFLKQFQKVKRRNSILKVSLNWLKNYVDYGDLTSEQLAEKITKSGIEVDGIEYIASEKSHNVVVGHVKECDQHPDADKLKLCQVDVGDEEPLQIVCGASNVAKGQKVVVAKPGGILPGNFKIKKVKLRGVESNGMICSMKELGVDEQFIPSQYAEGIIELPQNT